MTHLDHLILRVKDASKSVEFYTQVVGFSHEGVAAPFELIRVSEHLTLDLLEEAPKDLVHLAFSLDRDAFIRLHQRLLSGKIPFGSDVFDRNGLIGTNHYGARGLAQAFYFYDPDGHNLEARCYEGVS
ncbi:VOC family protein [Gallaecimonas kandeliae]|uniref:VOC family protein n=1 Tax=Gallaecimonas kandeliae TaxID=3029055 RepID=UPI0026481A47|nr:VOC family protein [Gallaecimonas kandeliae]WKE66977.1 VOC family protein [Gallaecimonas kandeliae]